MNRTKKIVALIEGIAFALCLTATLANAQTAPKSTADMAAILEHEKPDPKRIAQFEEKLRAQPPASPNAMYHYDRGMTLTALGRNLEAIEQFEKAIAAKGLPSTEFSFLRGYLSTSYRSLGEIAKSTALNEARLQELPKSGNPLIVGAYRHLVIDALLMADIPRAEELYKKMTAALSSLANARLPPAFYTGAIAQTEEARARLLEARGFYDQAEISFMKAAQVNAEALRIGASGEGAREASETYRTHRTAQLAFAGLNQARVGRYVEAEINARRGLMEAIEGYGRYSSNTVSIIGILASVVMQQGRYADAERLYRIQADTYAGLGYASDTLSMVKVNADLAQVLAVQERWDDAVKIYDEIEKAVAGWDKVRADGMLQTVDRVMALYQAGRFDAGIATAQAIVDVKKAAMGDGHFDTALARGQLATGYYLAGRVNEALLLYRAAIPIFTNNAARSDDGTDDAAANAQQVRVIVENYMALLARNAPADIDPATESLKLVDFIRGQSVQKALAASSARAAARDANLAALVRKEQDLKREIAGHYQLINDTLALPPDQRDAKVISALQTNVTNLVAQHGAQWNAIRGKFPDYANLMNPSPPSVEDIRKALRPDEAFVSFYLGRKNSFVWAVPKSGAIAFVSAPLGAGDIEQKVNKLREALEPEADTLEGIPQFDLGVAYDLYTSLLKPIESAWKPAKSLVFVTNGAMGLLPLGVLPTAPAQVKADPGQPLFAAYRSVPWLARTHAVTLVPSASAFTTLRNLPVSAKKRETMIGFGDPLFSKEQAAEAAREAGTQVAQATSTTRGVPLNRRNAPKTAGVNGAELALLPRLPDTSDELKSIALALQADPTKVLHLGKEANTRKVKTIDLSGYKIVAFATHGLVPGELEGLAQPALALSAPDVADTDGDGLLTMEEILGLKLDADWVVLSACNTGAGSGAGAEAASGLGRAFFYAGSRALLVTNWSVHSVSARELVTDLFRRQAEDAKLSRSEALRAASMALLDGAGFQDGGKTIFTYAHPIFWAPYSIIGDGGGA